MSSKPDSGMTIGRLADRSGVHVETIRYYQRLGLVPIPKRHYASVRRYAEDAVARLQFIKRAQALGFSLEEVKLLLALSIGAHCVETRTLAEQKRRLVEKKIGDLRAIRRSLDKLIRACESGGDGAGCPVIESLSGDAAPGRETRESRPHTPARCE
jgi:MerR family transcriptional regulator, mercuric resistance operon regulatory protein